MIYRTEISFISYFVINVFKITYAYKWRRLAYKYTLRKYTATCYSWIVEYDVIGLQIIIIIINNKIMDNNNLAFTATCDMTMSKTS